MNMKSLKTQFIGAIAMVLVAAIAMGSSTYAWFSMNSRVEASGMQISAKNVGGSLIIGAQTYNTTSHAAEATPTLASVQAANMTAIDLSQATYNYTNDFSVKPSAHATGTQNDPLTLSVLNTVGNWHYKNADAPNSYASSGSTVALTSFTDQVIYYDLYLTVAAGSAAMNNLKCNATIQASGTGTQEVRNAVRVVVASESAAEEFYNAHKESGTDVVAHTTGETVLASNISDQTLVHLRVYIYLDGEDYTVFTNNFRNLAAATVALEFTAGDAA